MKKKYCKLILIVVLFFFASSMFGQKQIKGKVISKSNVPVAGVSILVKGTVNEVSSDFDGNFVLSNVSDKDVVLFSFVGFKPKEVLVGNLTTINVSLEEDVMSLADVVVVGYGAKKKSEVISSVAKIKGDEVKTSPAANYATSLAGRLPGLFINQRSSDPGQENLDILIRGRGTFGDNSVLIVIDGVVGRDGLSRLDPQDVESISVLKDASASIYGARAANGVILVTTKRGKEGKPIINFNTNYSVSAPTTLVKGATPYNYARQVNAMRVRDGQSELYSQAELDAFQSGSFKGIDFWDELFNHQSSQQRHNLTISGGSKNMRYFTSLGSTNQDPIVNFDKVTNFKQYNVRSNLDVDISDNLTVGMDIAGRFENVVAPPYMFEAVDNTSKTMPTNEQYIVDDKFIRLLDNQPNPFAYIQQQAGKVDKENTLFNGTLKLNYKFPFLKGLSFNTWGAVDYIQNYVNTFNNDPIQYILESDGTLTPDKLGLDVSVKEEYFRQRSLTYFAKLAFERSFEDHSVSAFIGYEENRTKNNGNVLSRRGGLISEDLPYLSQGDPNTQTADSALGESARQAYIGRVTYDYDKKYLAEFGMRYDGSYIFPAGQRFGFFPYTSAGWVVSKENFFKDNNTISLLKLRGTWGITGNDRVQPFQYLQRFQNPTQGGGVFYLDPNATNNSAIPLEGTNLIILTPAGVDPNPNITWETKKSWDLGFELGLLSNKINLEVSYFSEKRESILAPRNVTIPTYTGLNPPYENIGKTKNHGVEAIASYRTKIGELNLNLGGNISYAKNELVFNDAPKPEEPYQDLQGHPIGSSLVYNAVGIYRTQEDLNKYPSIPLRPNARIGDLIYADTNGDGQITTADRIVMEKSSIPTIQYGFNLGFNYKNFEFTSFWQGQSGSALQIASFLNQGISSADYFAANAWTPDTPNGSLPAIGGTKSELNGYTSYANNYFTYNTNFLRLKTLQLAYNIPKEALKSSFIKNCRIYTSGSNLLTFSKFNNLNFADPEQTEGLGYGRPLQKLYNLGLDISF
ncbi:TonB-dependent receptor [Flavobacterium sp. LPB0248]|uniref:SusC/RagA family TonB-linked outer membrane protein n=1 Tax=Flavobacterium sp. LPB0248 TaxID=2614441 RepID=UPI0015A6D3BE|nr:TonB-dependent receptor [Flavobacterium sp. LPB0248]QLC65972.1 TonB-dependent receptor [Flavobacterium sp. LPB0248]